jgi:aspartate racemase
MIAETAERIATHHTSSRRVGLLATHGTVASGIYARSLQRWDRKVVLPGAVQQEMVDGAIASVKHGNTDPSVGRALAEVAEMLVRDGAEVIVAGCTEIPLVLLPAMTLVPLVDSTQVLAEAAVREGWT